MVIVGAEPGRKGAEGMGQLAYSLKVIFSCWSLVFTYCTGHNQLENTAGAQIVHARYVPRTVPYILR